MIELFDGAAPVSGNPSQVVKKHLMQNERSSAIPTLGQIEHQQRNQALLVLPMFRHRRPDGTTAADNVKVAAAASRGRSTSCRRPHRDLGAALGILDFERAARIAGARFSVLSSTVAGCARALIDTLISTSTRASTGIAR